LVFHRMTRPLSLVLPMGRDGALAGFSDYRLLLCPRAGLVERQRPDPNGSALFGLTNAEVPRRGRQGASMYYLDGTPTHSYSSHSRQIPPRRLPLRPAVVEENRRRCCRTEREFCSLNLTDRRFIREPLASMSRSNTPQGRCRRHPNACRRCNKPRGPSRQPCCAFRSFWARNSGRGSPPPSGRKSRRTRRSFALG